MRTASVILALLICGCVIRHINRPEPELFVNISTSYQTCARKDGTAKVIIFATRVGMPPGDVVFHIQNGKDITLYANPTAVLELERTGVGGHRVEIDTPEGVTAFASWTVYECP